jgi:hypothetical protein
MITVMKVTAENGSTAQFPLSNFTTGISVGMASAYDGASACGTAATGVIFYK